MKTIPLVVVLLLLLGFAPATALAQGSTSNKGTEFWTVWMNHKDDTGSNMSLYITGDSNTSGSVDFIDGVTASIPFTVTANAVTVVNIPTSVYLAAGGKFSKGIHITSLKNIVVYAHIYANARSGATLVLPVNAMGKDYYSINYTQKPATAFSAFCVVATENNTSVEITPTAKLTTGEAANTKFTITLQKGEVYQGLSSTDLTGTHIKSVSTGTEGCKKIAVYSGSSWIAITCTTKASADNLFQQSYPTASWGKSYVTAPLSGRNYDVFRIVYSDPTAIVKLNGTAIPQSALVNNLYYEFTSSKPNSITSDKPIQVVQYAVTQGSNVDCTINTENVGDPEMIFLSPIEQGLDHVTLYSTNKQNITQSYINVILPTSAVSTFIYDGTAYNNFSAVTGTTYSYAQIKVNSGTHTISASLPFNAIAYGFGNVESYGYAAGTDLKNLNEFIELKDPATNATSSSGCVNITYKPQISIPYQTTKISWDLKDGTAPVVDNSPILKGTVVKGTQTLYIYEYANTVTYTTSGSYSIVATVLNPTADDCGSDEQIEFDYTISDIPAATFTASALNICPGTEITFTDKTDTKGINTKTWLWDFGDGTTGTTANATQNPKHTYPTPGNYNVTVTLVNENGCSNTSPVQVVHVNKPPVAAFMASDPDCETKLIAFTDQSTSPETAISPDNKIATWAWDFGDANADPDNPNTTSAQNPQHYYKVPGTYTVTLTVTSNTGCSNMATQTVVVHALPVVDFTLPDVCLSDAFAQFTNKTTISDGTDAQLTYIWDFGDAARSTALNPNTSTAVSPKHKYTQVGSYTVTLTATSNNGCVVVKSQTFTVNGDTPNAAFTVNNLGNTYCSTDDVLFKDNSTVNFGNITKLVWYFDYNNNPTVSQTYNKEDFPTDGIYHHNYSLFNTPSSKTYAVKMEAYSGGTCVSVTGITNVTVYANPFIDVTPLPPLCQESPATQIQAIVKYGNGTGVCSGTGVSPLGLFDPAKSGPGTFTITYKFITAATGCIYGTSFPVTVYPTPKADAGGDLHLLQGGTITINATASGVQPLKYKWTMMDGSPAVGLNHDDVLTPIASPNDDVTYLLTVTSAEGCTASSKVSIAVLKAPVVPNTFTPNRDGVNDTWEIKYLDTYPNCTIDVYNRYGEKLYSSVGYPIAWDGTFKGTDVPVGTYYYIINPKNGRKVITGSITIIR
ncbi:PKD domain-containing protein [Mucilaginibacter boryungensis]|uniref:PKD domain-containing protein n=1 Tax=Mucilaginibacter boryungensis TaxID=768480 RepID=A0ABR9XF07_9SPHI|nr:PKD domain-containing protein [Mucilaginibacter boryungensis]MBE9665963.1 PKD domain-containing protein [Mucilaginibacter boryungensis]